MDKRIGWNLDSNEDATFNWLRPMPAYSKARSQFSRRSTTFLDEARILSSSTLFMSAFKRRIVFWASVVLLILFWAIAVGPEPPARISMSPEELVRAVTIQRDSLIDLCLMEHVDPNGRDAQGRTPLLIAMSQKDWKTAQRLLAAGARVDIADKNNFTPLMAAAMHGNLDMFKLILARSDNIHPEVPCTDGRDLLGLALDGGNPEIINTVIERLPQTSKWTTSARHALNAALVTQNKNQIRALLSKHSAPPTPEGKSVPFLAYAIAGNNSSLFTTLLACGADPNTVLPPQCDKDFLAMLSSKSMRSYAEEDRNLNLLMLAAGLGQDDYLRALLEAGANRNRWTSRYKMSALDVAAETGHWRAAQLILGGGPSLIG